MSVDANKTEWCIFSNILEKGYVTFSKKVVNLGFGQLMVVVGQGRGEKLVWLAVAGKVALSTWIRHQGGQSDA